MKPPACPKCISTVASEEECPKVYRHGFNYRTSDSKKVQRYRCTQCKTCFSDALFDCHYRQKKRQKNELVVELLVSNVSMRRTAKICGVNRVTVARILELEAADREAQVRMRNYSMEKATIIQFDDLETFEHTKCKPLSVTLAVEETTRRILGLDVAVMAANGRLAEKSLLKYGKREDQRGLARNRLFKDLTHLVVEDAIIKSDQNPYYPNTVREHFPKATHKTYKGKPGTATGQGETKAVKFDPIFTVNQTLAMFRANVCRLIRKTWCTTKRMDRLYAHLMLYVHYHNFVLIPQEPFA